MTSPNEDIAIKDSTLLHVVGLLDTQEKIQNFSAQFTAEQQGLLHSKLQKLFAQNPNDKANIAMFDEYSGIDPELRLAKRHAKQLVVQLVKSHVEAQRSIGLLLAANNQMNKFAIKLRSIF